MQLPANVTAQTVDRETAFEVGAKTGIFDPVALGQYQVPETRRKNLEQLEALCVQPGAEAVAFYNHEGSPVGWFWGYMEYADTFVIDTMGLIPEYRGKGVYSAFLRRILDYLKAVGYERVTVLTFSNNRAMLVSSLKAGFSIVGMEISEATGAMVKLAYIIHDDRRSDFTSAFRIQPDDSFRKVKTNARRRRRRLDRGLHT